MLRLDSGEWCSDGETLKAKVVDYFSRLYADEGEANENWQDKGQFPLLTTTELEVWHHRLLEMRFRTLFFR